MNHPRICAASIRGFKGCTTRSRHCKSTRPVEAKEMFQAQGDPIRSLSELINKKLDQLLPTTNKYPHFTGIQVDKLKIKKEPTGRIPATFRLARASNQGQTAISKANIKFQLSPLSFI